MILTRKVQIQPGWAVQQTLWSISDLCTELWNAGVEQRRQRRSYGKVNGNSQKRELPAIKRELPEFKAPSSQVLQNVLLGLDGAYKSFFKKWQQGDRQARPPGFRARRHFFTQEYSQPRNSFALEEGRLGLAYGKSRRDWLWIDLPAGEYAGIRTVEIRYDRLARKWYACLTYQVAETPLKPEGAVIYFDPGCKTALTGIKTDGSLVEYDLNPLRQLNMSTYKLIDTLTSRRDRKTRGSYRHRRLDRRIRALFRKIETRTKAYLHSLANRILNDHPDVVSFKVGNWKKQETLADTGIDFVNRRINRAVQNNNPLSRLLGYLSYKAALRGQQVAKFDERGSTRTCVQCEHVHKEGIDPKVRLFCCEQCGFTYPRDHHSTLNFARQFQPALWQRLSGNLPDRSVRTTFSPFAFKPQVLRYALKLAS